jgi:hypothetical protein
MGVIGMADYSAFLEDQEDDDQGMAAVRKALRAADRRAKEAEERAEKAESTARAATLNDLLKEAGLKTAVARYVPKDVNDADSLEVWLKSDEGSVFADSRAPKQDEGNPDQHQDDEALRLFGKISRAEQGGDQRQPVNGDKVGQALAGLAGKDLSDKDLLAAFAALDQGKLP